MSSANKVSGVETNEFSRFVDHTLATPWETLISDIEKAIRSMQQRKQVSATTGGSSSSMAAGEASSSSNSGGSGHAADLHKISITFQNIEFYLEDFNFHEVDLRYSAAYYSIENNWITSKLDLDNFLMFYPNIVRGTEYDAQLFMTVCSAFNVAVKSVTSLSCAIFCTTSLIRLSDDNSSTRRLDFHLIDHLVGYRYLPTQHVWLRYQSTSYEKMTQKHPLYFYDGIRKLYQKKVRVLGLDRQIGHSAENMLDHFTSSVSHYFEYDATTWLSMCIPFQPKLNQNFTTNYTLQQLSSLLQHHSEAHPLHPLQYQKLVLDKIRVAIEFHELKQHSIIDNETYSTFLPSRQAPMFWKLTSTFHPTPFVAATSNSVSSLPEEVGVMCQSIWRSRIIHKLLSFVLLMYYIGNNNNNLYRDTVTMESRFFYEKFFDEVGLEELRQLVGYFSPALQKSFFSNVFPEEFLSRFPSFANMVSQSKHGTNPDTSRQSSSSAAPPMNSSPHTSRSKSLTPTMSVASDDNNNSSHHAAMLNTSTISADEELNEEAESAFIESLLDKVMMKSAVSSAPTSPTKSASSSNSSKDKVLGTVDYGTDWIRFFAIFVGLQSDVKASGIFKLWQACMREYQALFDENQGGSWSKLMHQSIQKGRAASASCKERGCPIFCQSLWDESIHKKAKEGIHTSCPQLSSSLLVQKLQMIHFCLVMKEESPIYQFTKNTSVVNDEVVYNPRLFKRLPMTIDVLAVQKHIAKKFQGENNLQALRDNPMLPFQVRYPSLLSDINAFKAANPHADLEVFCQWYGILDDFESKSSRHCDHHADGTTNNSEAENVENIPVLDKEKMMQTLTEIWQDVGAGKGCDEQKILFHAEKELGKAIAFIDRMHAFNFAADLLFQATQWITASFEHVISKYLFSSTANQLGLKQLDEKMTNLKQLSKKIDKILTEKNAPRPSTSSSAPTPSSSPVPTEMLNSPDSASNSGPSQSTPVRLASDMELFQLFDEFAAQVEEIEVIVSKMTQVNVMVHTMHNDDQDRKTMLDTWIKHHQQSENEEYSLNSEEEVKSLRSIIKSIHHRNGKGHEWYSYDGRELGLPHSKDFLLKSYRKSFHSPNLSSSSVAQSTTISRSSTDLALSSHQATSPHSYDETTAAIKLEFQDENSSPMSSSKIDTREEELKKKDVHDFEFLACTDGNSIRVICSTLERD